MTMLLTHCRHTLVVLLILILTLTGCTPLPTDVSASASDPLSLGSGEVFEAMADLYSPDPSTRLDAAYRLGEMGPDAQEAVTALSLTTRDSDANVRAVAAFALGKIAKPTQPVVEALMSSLADENENVRFSAARALGKIGPNARDAAQKLYAVVTEDESGNVRSAAAAALASIGPTDEMAPGLINTLKHPNWYVRQSVAEALVANDSKAAEKLRNRLATASWSHRNTILDVLPLLEDSAIPLLVEWLNNDDIENRSLSAVALVHTGPDAIPAIAAAIQDDGSPSIAAIGALGHLGKQSIPILIDHLGANLDEEVEDAIIEALVNIGRPAILPLTKVLPNSDNEGVDVSVFEALEEMNEVAVPLLIPMLRSSNSDLRLGAAGALGGIGPPAERAVSHLIALLQNEQDPGVRLAALAALGSIQRNPPEVLPVLAAIVTNQQEDSDVRSAAIRALGQFRGEAWTAIPDLIDVMQENDTDLLHKAAIEALDAIAPRSHEVHSTFIAGLANETEDPVVRQQAALALGKVGYLDEHTVTTLIEVLSDETINPGVRSNAATALGYANPAEDEVIAALTDRLGDPEESIRGSASASLGGIGTLAIPSLMEKIRNDDPVIRAAASRALNQMGEAAVPILVEELSYQHANSRQVVVDVLGQIGEESVQALTLGLLREELPVRQDIVEALIKIRPQALAGLLVALQDEDPDIREKARTEIEEAYQEWQIDGEVVTFQSFATKEAVPILVSILQESFYSNQHDNNSETNLQMEAIIALGLTGSDAVEAVPLLEMALRSNDADIRCEAAISLLLIGSEARPSAATVASILRTDEAAYLCELDDEDRDIFDSWLHAEALEPLVVHAKYNNNSVELRQLLIALLTMFDTEATVAIPELADALYADHMRLLAVQAFGHMGSTAVPALREVLDETRPSQDSALEEALQGKNADVRRGVLYALLLNRESAVVMLSDLMTIALDANEDSSVRTMAVAALEHSGYDMREFWQDSGLANPTTVTCPSWMDMGVDHSRPFDIYYDQCRYDTASQAPTVKEVFQAIKKKITGS